MRRLPEVSNRMFVSSGSPLKIAASVWLRSHLSLRAKIADRRRYQKTDQETKNGYRTASIHILPVTEVNDSTTIIVYSNSFKNDPDTLRVLRMNGKWLVDLKYLYEHDMDTTLKKPLLNDSLK